MIADVLREHLEELSRPAKCSMGKWLDTQEEEIQALFEQISRKPTINSMALYKSLETVLPFKLTTFKLHIKGNCPCPKV
jgi:hypothetical protein